MVLAVAGGIWYQTSSTHITPIWLFKAIFLCISKVTVPVFFSYLAIRI